ncbi:uncharacterized protein LOC141903857 [Tubulanus polymorphus]|uniref:uncharacterized protein LOC141903857 n=1 Tax=Tubulanus polymorphus TaxID=672921 RepID=UPI003DA22F04
MEAQIDDDHMKSKNQSEIENKTDRHFISEIQPLDASDSCHFVLNYIFDNHCSIHEKRNEQSSVDERNKCHCQLVLDYLYGQMSDVTNDLMNSFQMRVHHIAGPDLPVKLQKYSDLCQQRLKQLFRTPAMSQIENASTFLDSCKVKLNTLFDKSVGILFPTSVGLSSESKVSTEGKTDVSSVSNESLSKATAVKSKPAPRTTVLGVGLIPTNPRAKLKQGTQLRNVLTRMQDIKGPISVLYTALQERLRVKVWTRGARQLRGYCLGYIVAFDKYWNLAMVDVDEIYVKPFRKKPDRQKPANNQKQTNLEPVDPGMSTNSAPCYPHVPVASDNPQLELRVYDNTNSEQVDLAALSNKLKQFRSELLDLSGTEKSSSLSIERTRKHRSDLTETRTSSDVLFQTSVESFTTNPEFMRMAEVNSVEMEKLNDNRDDNHNVAEKSDDKPKRPAAVGTVVPNYHDPWCRKTIALPNRWGKCIERHVNQLFLRGDSVVSVGILE